MKHFLSSAILCLLLALPRALSAQSDSAAVVATVQRLFDAMAMGDTAAARSILLPGMRFVATLADTTSRARTQSDTSFIRQLATDREAYLERMWSPVVHVDGPLAVLWTPYDFHIGTQWSHCGTDTVTLVRADGGWRIAAFAYTVQRRNCAPSPLGPPRQ